MTVRDWGERIWWVLNGILREFKRERKLERTKDKAVQLKRMWLISQIVRVLWERGESFKDILKELERNKVWPKRRWEKKQMILRNRSR